MTAGTRSITIELDAIKTVPADLAAVAAAATSGLTKLLAPQADARQRA